MVRTLKALDKRGGVLSPAKRDELQRISRVFESVQTDLAIQLDALGHTCRRIRGLKHELKTLLEEQLK